LLYGFGELTEGRSLNPTVAGDDTIPAVNQNGVGESEDANAIGDLPDLMHGMSPRVLWTRLKLIQLSINDVEHERFMRAH